MATTSRYAKRHEESMHEFKGRIRYALSARKQSNHFRVVRRPQRGVWYDFADPETKTTGQCKLNEDGSWHQAPKGNDPVILAYRPPNRNEPGMAEELIAIALAAVELGPLRRPTKRRKFAVRMRQDFAKDGVFSGSIRIEQPKGSTKCLYHVTVRGLRKVHLDRLCRFLRRLK